MREGWTQGVPFAPEGQVWVFPKQGVVYTEVTTESPTPSDANALIDMFQWLKTELDPSAPPVIVHDWRSMRAISRETRQVFLTRRREIREQPARIVVAVDVNPLIRMVIRTAALGAQLVSGTAPIDLVKNPALTLAEFGVKSPDRELHARLRASFEASALKTAPI
jgi:hypothetical protein